MELPMQLIAYVFEETWKKTVALFKPGSLKDQLLARIYNMNINYVHNHDQE